jgi:pimeloyl-ACP methyl ester carboxylesterase
LASAAPDPPFRLGDLPPLAQMQTRCGVLEYAVVGEGAPAVVLFNGAGVTLAGWRALYPRITTLAPVLAWNRFGLIGSNSADRLQSGALVTASVRELLGYTQLEPPYVLVGHSLGGLYANLFARLHPDEVAGVLMLEATHPRDREVLRMDETHLVRSLRKVLSLPEGLFADNLHSEVEAVDHVVREIESAGKFPDVPVTVITGGMPPPKWIMSEEALEARLSHQRELAMLSSQGRHVLAKKSGHFPQLSEPGVVLDALAEILVRARCRATRTAGAPVQ